MERASAAASQTKNLFKGGLKAHGDEGLSEKLKLKFRLLRVIKNLVDSEIKFNFNSAEQWDAQA